MKKTRFFYEINYFLFVLLGWLLLLGKAVEVNREKDREMTEKRNGYVSEEMEAAKKVVVELSAVENKSAMSDIKEIRVLLMTSGYQSYYHPSVTVKLDGKEYVYTPESEALQKGPLILAGKDGKFAISSIKRQEALPVYQGTLEIRKTDQGLLLINELPLENYLESVVPSEMPASYEMQALMAQAVCARTYAVCQMEEGTLEEYGADVDDSVNYQVYGNCSASDRSSQAVKDTKGQILCQNGKPVTAYYFSTSSGKTSTDEIWGTESSPYLQSVECDFDQQQPWSSWNVEIPWSMLQEKVNGQLSGLQVTKKSESGAVTELLVLTKEEEPQAVQGEYAVRKFLAPEGLTITEKDKSQVTGGSILPSAYFDLEIQEGKNVKIKGRGYGHGVGMSQNAANEMAKEGYTWQEILGYFFKNTSLETWGKQKK